jgi:DNA-binding SARP family transcriptional activator
VANVLVVYALGTSRIDFGIRSIGPSSGRKFALLLRLSADPGQRVPRLTLNELLFPGQSERNARHSLRELVYQIRQAGVAVESDTDGVMVPAHQVEVDVDTLIRGGDLATVDEMRAAQGGLLPGYAPDHSEAFTEWYAIYHAERVLGACRALVRAMTRARVVGDWATVECAARACLALEPTHEEATLALAETLAASGAKAGAVTLLDRYVRDLGTSRTMLHLPASLMRRRISERVPEFDPKPLTLPFVGRDEEMLKLHERFELARNGESQCVVLAGDAGIGKTRLAEEFCTKAVLSGARVERVVVQPHDRMRPLGALADLVPRLVELPGALGCSPESLSLLQRLTTHNPAASTTMPMPDAMSSEVLQSAISRALADLIDSITSESMLVVVVDDAQWSDDVSRQTLAALASARHQRRLMVMLTSRDKTISRFFAPRTERLAVLSLRPLAAKSVSLIVARLLEDPLSSDAELRDWIVEVSGGNPFFLRCLIAHFQTSGERFTVPATLNTVLDQQLAGLSDTSMSILRTCVALGRHSDLEHLEKALEVSFLELQTAIAELEGAHLLVQADARIEPAHRLVSDAVDRSLSPISRRVLHRRLAAILEDEARGLRSASQLWECAEHWALAEEHKRATEMMHECANHSLELGRPREAAEVLLRAAARINEGERCSLLTRAVQLADAANEHDVVFRGADLARSLGVTISYDGFELAEIIARVSIRDDTTEAFSALRPWIEAGTPLNLRLKAAVHLVILADIDDKAHFGLEAFEALSDIPQQVILNDCTGLTFLLIYHSRFGDISQSVKISEQLLELSRTASPAQALDLKRKGACALARAGHDRPAMGLMHEVYQSARETGLHRLKADVATMMAGLSNDLGDTEGAREWLTLASEATNQLYEARLWNIQAILRATVECTEGNLEKTRELLRLVNSNLPRTPTVRTGRWLLGMQRLVQILGGERLDPDQVVPEMTAHHRVNGETGDLSDLEIAVAALSLEKAGRRTEARGLVSYYFDSCRRCGGGPTRPLQIALQAIDWHFEARPRGELGAIASSYLDSTTRPLSPDAQKPAAWSFQLPRQ